MAGQAIVVGCVSFGCCGFRFGTKLGRCLGVTDTETDETDREEADRDA